MAVSFQSSPARPVPLILPDTPFSQRKRTPFRARHFPTSPAKSCPPVSRVFTTPKQRRGPQLVSFKSERRVTELSSPYYNAELSSSYFEQCFEVLEKLGQGSFGDVYKVRSKEDGKLYAIKRTRQRFRGRLDRSQKLKEVEKHEKLPPHANCVKFHKAWEERDCLYIQTELCQESLSEYADTHGRLPESQVWSILLDLLRGLKHLHDNNLCHFDIKPANIFLGGEGVTTCKLGDFGLCTALGQDSPAMEGDSKYMAPELLREGFDKPADVFSLGISVLELACNLELPTDGQNWQLLRQAKLPTDFIKDLSPALVDLLSRMMHPDPSQRPTVDEILAERSLRLLSWRSSVWRACVCSVRIVSVLITVLLSLFTFIAKPFKGTKAPDIQPSPPLVNGQLASSISNESFSDNEELSQDHETKFNKSWIQNSPVRYPSPLYTGPPIPLDFGDSSDSADPSPCKPHRSSPYLRVNGLNTSFTPRSSLNDSLLDSLNNSTRSTKLNIEPKNLMEAFSDSSD